MNRGEGYTRRGACKDALEAYSHALMGSEPLEPGFEGVRNTYLLDKIQVLGKVYPDAIEYLKRSRLTLEHRILAGENMGGPDVLLYAHLNERLGATERGFELLNQSAVHPQVRATLFGALPADQLFDSVHAPKYFDELAGRLSEQSAIVSGDRKAILQQALLLFTAMARARRGDDAQKLLRIFESLQAPAGVYGELSRVCEQYGDTRLAAAVHMVAARACDASAVPAPSM